MLHMRMHMNVNSYVFISASGLFRATLFYKKCEATNAKPRRKMILGFFLIDLKMFLSRLTLFDGFLM